MHCDLGEEFVEEAEESRVSSCECLLKEGRRWASSKQLEIPGEGGIHLAASLHCFSRATAKVVQKDALGILSITCQAFNPVSGDVRIRACLHGFIQKDHLGNGILLQFQNLLQSVYLDATL